MARRAVQPTGHGVAHATHKIAGTWPQLVCKQIAPGLAGLGLAALGPASVPHGYETGASFGPGGVGGVPGGFVSEYGGPSLGSAGASAAVAGAGASGGSVVAASGGAAGAAGPGVAEGAISGMGAGSGGVPSGTPGTPAGALSPNGNAAPVQVARKGSVAMPCTESTGTPSLMAGCTELSPGGSPAGGPGGSTPAGPVLSGPSGRGPESGGMPDTSLDEPPSLLIVAVSVLFTALLRERWRQRPGA